MYKTNLWESDQTMISCDECGAEIGMENPTDTERSNEELAYQIHILTHAIERLNENMEKK